MIREINTNELDKVFSDILEASNSETKYSIPDVYGRAIRLGIILKDFFNVQEKNIPEEIIQWRGILTILALKDFLQLDVEIESISLESLPDSTSAFRKAITLKPKNSVLVSEGWDWETYHVIKIKNRETEDYVDIALFSPSTLVYPVADINKVMPKMEEITWFDGEGFINPVEYLNQEQKKIVSFWLGEMIAGLRPISLEIQQENNEGNRLDAVAVVIRHLEKYQKQLGTGNYESFSLEPITNTQIGKYKAYEFINQTVKVKVYIGDKVFDFREVFTQKIQCIKGIEKEEIFPNCKNSDRYKIENKKPELKIPQTTQMYAILPIGKQVVKQVPQEKLEELCNNIEMWWEDRKSVAVRIHFSKVDNKNVDITKVITCAGENIWDEKDVQIALWPREEIKDWKKYYLYFYKGTSNFEVCHSEGKIKERTGGYVYEYSQYPFKVEFEENTGGNKIYLGVLLPWTGVNIQGGNRAAEVVIDFGTSATVCYAKIDGQEERPIFFEQENSVLLVKKNDAYSDTQIAQNFVPLEIEKKKMYSVYKAFEKNVVYEVEPILDGIIYYARNMEVIPENIDEGRFLTDLKWMTNTNRVFYQAFLCQLCMQITLYLKRQNVGNIRWKYALPLSLSKNEWEAVGDAWIEIKKALESMDRRIKHEVETAVTESEAVSNYFYHHKQVNDVCQLEEEAGYIIADIGGGSIDFSLWKKNTGTSRMWETSVPVASRKLFSQIALDESENIAELYAPNDENEIKKQNQLFEIARLDNDGKRELAIAFLEKFVEDNSEDLQKKIGVRENDEGFEWIKTFRKKLSLGAAMVLYCAGLMVGEKINSQEFIICNTRTFYVVLAGNGSKLFDWLFKHTWKEASEEEKEKFINVFLKGVQSKAVGVNLDVKIVKSLYPKKEVALGLMFTNGNIQQEEFLKSGFTESEIVNWKERFLEVYSDNFGEYNYGRNAAWNNIASRAIAVNNDSCNIMLQDILKQLY